MKQLLSLVMVFAMVLACTVASAEGFGEKDPASYDCTLRFMVQSTAQPTYMIEKFNEVYPNIRIELVEVPSAELQEKIINMVVSGEDVTDLFACRTQFVKAIVNGGDRFYMDLYTMGDTHFFDTLNYIYSCRIAILRASQCCRHAACAKDVYSPQTVL